MSAKTPNRPQLTKKIHPLLLVCFVLMLASCSSIEIFKENTEIPMARPYQTFVIVNKELGMRGFSSQFLDEMVQIQMQETLEEAGMVYDAKQPDLVIRYNSNEDPRQRETVNNPNPYPYWGYRVYDPWMYNPYNMPRVTTSSYELLQVIVDFIDPARDKFLMTLTGVTEVSSPKYKEKKVRKTLDSVLNSFLNQNQAAGK
ncbi:DUF4136 domain-containing protein [Algoriphagus sp. H41]|uniref:DUF4136 domain-containing protein n=1 Tax=Algoriphagus oliviformis TaxID=2811231 RepID=A0ABS3C7R8_9BACT|nr:DUF4136 domain-containing protein [Algoriphagus oliviformis]